MLILIDLTDAPCLETGSLLSPSKLSKLFDIRLPEILVIENELEKFLSYDIWFGAQIFITQDVDRNVYSKPKLMKISPYFYFLLYEGVPFLP